MQGVGFRYEARARATSLGVAGWIENSPDGSVEAVLEGDPDRVAGMIEWCRAGPPGARVGDLELTWEEPAGEVGFGVR